MSKLQEIFTEMMVFIEHHPEARGHKELGDITRELRSEISKSESDLTRLTQELEEERDNKQGKSYAPWTDEQVAFLEKWQDDGKKHPFTCICGESLIPYKSGWECDECGYKQNWAHNFMVSPELPNEASQ